MASTSLTHPVKLTFWRFSAWQQWYLSCVCIYLLDKKWHKGWEKDCPITPIHTYCIFAHTTAGRLCLHSYSDNSCVHCGAPLFNFDFGRWVKSLYCSPSLVLWTIQFPRGFLLSTHTQTNIQTWTTDKHTHTLICTYTYITPSQSPSPQWFALLLGPQVPEGCWANGVSQTHSASETHHLTLTLSPAFTRHEKPKAFSS